MSDKEEIFRTQTLVLTALMTALIVGVTMIFKIPMVPYGYLNLGDVAVMIAAILLPVRGAIFAAGVGSLLADLFSGYPQYAFFSLFIKAVEVLIIVFMKKQLNTKYRGLPFFAAGLAMVFLYALVDGILLVSLNGFLISFINNLPQGILSAAILTFIYPKIKTSLERLRSLDR